jgi:hypothetical protein
VDLRNIIFSCAPSYSQRFPPLQRHSGPPRKGKHDNRAWRLQEKKYQKSNKKIKQSTKLSTLSHKTTTTTQNVGVKFCFHSNFDNNNSTLFYFNEKVKVSRYLKQVWPFSANLGLFQLLRIHHPSSSKCESLVLEDF